MEEVKQSPAQKIICQQLNFYFNKTDWTKDRWSLESGVPAGRIKEYLDGERNPDIPTIEDLLRPLLISFKKFFRAKQFNCIPALKKSVQN